jgi:hypothetical protein
LPQTEWGVKTPERCQTLVVHQVSKRPLDGGAATVRGRPFGRAFKVEKTCRTVQADAQDDWFGPDRRREQTTCEWKVVSPL